METTPLAVDAAAASPSRCPIDHSARSVAGCPVHAGAAPGRRSRADLIVWKLFRIHERPAGLTDAAAQQAFSRSMVISGTRCLLTYVIFPFVLPLVGIAKGVGPAIGIAIGSVAIVCDVFTVRRFFAVDHRLRWLVGPICFAVIALLAVLLVQDITHLVT